MRSPLRQMSLCAWWICILMLSSTAHGLHLINKETFPRLKSKIFRRSLNQDASNTIAERQTSAPSCGAGLQVCEVQDPTRLEAPWHGVDQAFPQCYDPALYTCAGNFLCPINAPKIPGQYACSAYGSGSGSGQASPTSSSPGSASSGASRCGAGLLVCEVEDPTRLEAPWHGVYAAFPQCYDPSLYTCAENFLCPTNAPKIPGVFACGPYQTINPVSSVIGSNTQTSPTSSVPPFSSSSIPTSLSATNSISSSNIGGSTSVSGGISSTSSLSTSSGTVPLSSSSTVQSSSRSLTSLSSSQSGFGNFSTTVVSATTSTLPNGSLTTISGTTEILSSTSGVHSSPSGSQIVTTRSASTSTLPNGSLTTISGTTQTLSSGIGSLTSGSGISLSASLSETTFPGSISTLSDGSLTTLPGSTGTFSPTSRTGTNTISPGQSVTSLPGSVSTEPDGSLTTLPGSLSTIPLSSSAQASLTTLPGSISTEPDGSLTTLPGSVSTLPLSSSSQVSLTTLPGSVSTEPDGSLTTFPGSTRTLQTSSAGGGSESVTTILPTTSTAPDGSVTTISGTTETFSGTQTSRGPSVTTIPQSTSTLPNGSLTTISGTTETLSGSPTSSGPTLTTIPPSTSTLPDGSLTTISGTTETLSGTRTSGGASLTTVRPTTSTLPNGSLTTISGTTETISSSSSSSISSGAPALTLEPAIVIGGTTYPIGAFTETITDSDSSVYVIASSVIILGSSITVPTPTITGTTTMTTDGATFTFVPGSDAIFTTLPPAVDVIIGGSTWMLPATNVEIPQSDGSTITLGPNAIQVGGQSFTVPPASATTTLSAGGVSVSFQPGPTATSKIPSGGILQGLEGLQSAAGAISLSLSELGAAGSSWASGATSDSDFFSILGSLLDSAGSGLRGFSTSLSGFEDAIELQTLGEGLDEEPAGQVFYAQNQSRTLYNLITGIQNIVKGGANTLNQFRPILQSFWKPGAILLSTGAIDLIFKSAYSGSGTTTSTNLTSEQYLIATKSGTPSVVYKFFIQALDGGAGYQIAPSIFPWQSYVTEINPVVAAACQLLPFVDTVEIDTPLNTQNNGVPKDPHILPRDTFSNAPDWLSLISQKENTPLTNNYYYDSSQGQGSKIYVIDTGYYSFQTANTAPSAQLQGNRIQTYVVPNQLTARYAPTFGSSVVQTDLGIAGMNDWEGHGEFVARVAGGTDYSVAKSAGLYIIKYKQAIFSMNNPAAPRYIAIGATPSSIEDAWARAIADAAATFAGRQMKAVINFSAGITLSTDTALPNTNTVNPRDKRFQALLQICWENDIVTVVGAGNLGIAQQGQLAQIQDQTTPQRLGLATNPLITVGGTHPNGSLWYQTTPAVPVTPQNIPNFGTINGGDMTVYAQSFNVRTATAGAPADYQTGTSFAAPQVAALAAYFMGLPTPPNGLLVTGSTSQNVKNYIVTGDPSVNPSNNPNNLQLAWQRATPFLTFPERNDQGGLTLGYPFPQSVKIIYNGFLDTVCGTGGQSKRDLEIAYGSYDSSPWKINARQNACPISTSTSSTSTSTACFTSTVSFCTDFVTYGVGPGGSTTTTQSSATCSTTAGCSVTGSTVTSSTISTNTALPTQNVDQGILTCGPPNQQGNPTNFMSLDSMNSAVTYFCDYLRTENAVFTFTGSTANGQQGIDFHYNNNVFDPIYLSADITDLTDNCPTLDFKSDPDNAHNICTERLGDPINLCNVASNGFFYWKEGGQFFRDCITWTIRRDSWRDPSPAPTGDSYRPPPMCSDSSTCPKCANGDSPICAAAAGPSYCDCPGS